MVRNAVPNVGVAARTQTTIHEGHLMWLVPFLIVLFNTVRTIDGTSMKKRERESKAIMVQTKTRNPQEDVVSAG